MINVRKQNDYVKNVLNMRKKRRERDNEKTYHNNQNDIVPTNMYISFTARDIQNEEQNLESSLNNISNSDLSPNKFTMDRNNKKNNTMEGLKTKKYPNLKYKNAHNTLGEKFTKNFLNTLSNKKTITELSTAIFITNDKDNRPQTLPLITDRIITYNSNITNNNKIKEMNDLNISILNKSISKTKEKKKKDIKIDLRSKQKNYVPKEDEIIHKELLKRKYSNYRAIFKKHREIKINNWILGLNNDLANLIKKYGKYELDKRFSNDPIINETYNKLEEYCHYKVKNNNNSESPRKKILPLKQSKEVSLDKLSRNKLKLNREYKKSF
jgi:hypothetical protein